MKKVWYLLVSGLMLFAACGSDDDEPTKKGDDNPVYNVKSIVGSYPSETPGEMVESLFISYEYKDGKVDKIVIDIVDYMKQEVSFDYVSDTEANFVANITGMSVSQTEGKVYFDKNTHLLTSRVSNGFENKSTYNESNQLISEEQVYDGGSEKVEYVWESGNLISSDAGTIAYSDIKNNTNFDFGLMFSSDMPDGTSISQFRGAVSANVPSEITDSDGAMTIETQLDAKNRPASLVLSTGAVMKITYFE